MIGDSAYPLKLWLMKPFAHNTDLTSQQKNYNYRVSRARITIEFAYGCLKGRWCRLMKRNDMHVSNIPHVITVTCILHNVCEIHCEHFNDTWMQSGKVYYVQPETVARDTPSGPPRM